MRFNLERLTTPGKLVTFLAFLAVALQIQVTLFTDPTYLGLRLALSDLVLPFAGTFILWEIASRRCPFPKWFAPGINRALLAGTALFGWGIWNGYLQMQGFDTWALANRLGGWIVVLSYFYMAGWLGNRIDADALRRFAAVACVFGFASFMIALLLVIGIDPLGRMRWQLPGYPIGVLMVNRNAFAFLLCCLLVIWGTARRYHFILVPDRAMQVFFVILPLAWCYNGSRAGSMVCAALALLACLAMPKIFLRRFLPCLAAGLAICLALYAVNPWAVLREAQVAHLTNVQEFMGLRDNAPSRKVVHAYYPDVENAPHTTIQNKSDQLRVIVWKDAVAMWREAPLFGIGIGTFLHNQQLKYEGYLDQIDCTPLWLLTELGVAGLFLFAGLFLYLFIQLVLRIRRAETQDRWLYEACLIIMLIFALFSLVHQMMFARHLWFLLGLAFSFNLDDRDRLPKAANAA